MEQEPKPPDTPPPISLTDRWRRIRRQQDIQRDLEACAEVITKHLIDKIKRKR
jgi:hypothetical protein